MKGLTLILSIIVIFSSLTYGILFTKIQSIFHKEKILYETEHIISSKDLSPYALTQINCLAQNVYFEAANESFEGKLAVAFVTMNRVKNSYFPKSVCDVVKQRANGVCQFSWYCDNGKRINPSKYIDHKIYNEAKAIAIKVYIDYDLLYDPSKGALFYHANYVNPNWKNSMIHVNTIGRHIFYTHKRLM